MNKGLASLIPFFILLPGALAGCLSFGDDEPDCVEIQFPGPGSEFQRLTRFENPSDGIPSERNTTYSVVESGSVMAGDGRFHEVVKVVVGQNEYYVSMESGDVIRSDLRVGKVVILEPNGIMPLGSIFFGRCVSTGDHWIAPHNSPPGGHEVTILHASKEEVRAKVIRGPWERAVFGNGTISGNVFEYTWQDSRAFPDQFKNYGLSENGSTALRSVTQLLDQTVVPMEVKPTSTLEPVGEPSMVQRWPDMNHPASAADYQGFIAELESRENVNEYLSRHPEAYASWIKWEVIQEQETEHTVWWLALLRDDSDEAMLVEWVYRCFDDMFYRQLYGDCHYSNEYFGPGSFNQDESPWASVSPKALPENLSSVPLTSILEISGRLVPSEDPARIEWMAHPWDGQENRFGAATGRPGWKLWYGDIQGEMIVTSEGPRGNTGGYQAALWDFQYDAVGWAINRPFMSKEDPDA